MYWLKGNHHPDAPLVQAHHTGQLFWEDASLRLKLKASPAKFVCTSPNSTFCEVLGPDEMALVLSAAGAVTGQTHT